MGEKRKAELDLTEEESNDKKQKVDNQLSFGGFGFVGLSDSKEAKENKVIEGFIMKDIIDFSDIESRKKYRPDIDIISSDGIILKYHICKLVDNIIFNQLINECNHDNNEYKINLQLHDGRSINLMLNYVESNELFKKNLYACDLFSNAIIPNLYEIAKYLNMQDLMNTCCWMMENRMRASNDILNCYNRHKLDKSKLFNTLLRGWIELLDKLPDEFLSDCFNREINNNPAGIIQHLLSIYCPTDEQMRKFTVLPIGVEGERFFGRHEIKPVIQRFMNGKVPQEIIAEFFSKYLNKKNNPPGIDKFVHRLAELCFAI